MSTMRLVGTLTVLLTTATASCSGPAAGAPAAGATGSTSPAEEAPAQPAHQDITHLEPRPDFVGPQPERFSWSKADAADSYTLRIWNDSDVRVVSESGLSATTIDVPKEYEMPPGTYFWAVVGMRGDQPVAESGLAAFVVQTP